MEDASTAVCDHGSNAPRGVAVWTHATVARVAERLGAELPSGLADCHRCEFGRARLFRSPTNPDEQRIHPVTRRTGHPTLPNIDDQRGSRGTRSILPIEEAAHEADRRLRVLLHDPVS